MKFDFNNIFNNNVNKKKGILELGNIYNNVQNEYDQYQGLIENNKNNQPTTRTDYDPSQNGGYPIHKVAPNFVNFNKPESYPEYVTKDLNGFQKISKLFGGQYPSQEHKMAVYDMLSNLNEAELNAYTLDPQGFTKKYHERFNKEPEDRKIVNINGVQMYLMNDGTTIPVSLDDTPDARPTSVIDDQVYYIDVNPPELVLESDMKGYNFKEGWIIDQLNIYDDSITKVKSQLTENPNDPTLLRELFRLERAKKILMGEEVDSTTNSNDIADANSPVLDEVDKDIKTTDIGKWQTEFNKSASNMSNQIQVKNNFQPEFLQLGGKTKVWWNNFVDKNNPSSGVNKRNELFTDAFGNTKINSQTGTEMTNGEFTDLANEWYANSLQGQNMAIRAQTGAVMNINETGRILKAMPDSGFANPDDGGIFSLPSRLLSGDSPYAFAIKQDDLMSDLAKVHIRTAIIQKNQLAVPDISIKHLTSPTGKQISLEEWQELSYDEQYTSGGVSKYKVQYNNPEEVKSFKETPYKWSKGIYQDGSEMTLNSVWKSEKRIVKDANGKQVIKYKHSGYVPDEMYAVADNILTNGLTASDYQLALMSDASLDKATMDSLVETGNREALFGIIGMPKVLMGYGLTMDSIPFAGTGLQQKMFEYEHKNRTQ
jgi:hypothetical protein